METVKSYTCIIRGTQSKTAALDQIYKDLQILSDLAFKNYKSLKLKDLYALARIQIPTLNSKILQNFLRFSYYKKKAWKIKSPVKPTIYLDYQNFKFSKSERVTFFTHWLKFSRTLFPLCGNWPLDKIANAKRINLVTIRKSKDRFYCKFSCVFEAAAVSEGHSVAADVNIKKIVFSNNTFCSLAMLAHRKLEHKKNKQQLGNFTTDFLHKATTKICDDLVAQGVKHLVLEKLTHIRKSTCRKLGTSKGKHLNYLINSWPYAMIQSFLSYKCLERGIAVEFVDPAYTSKTCSRCGSRNTSRPVQNSFICNDCEHTLHADLNAARNIWACYTQPKWPNVNLGLSAA